jgi:hypothetical protein
MNSALHGLDGSPIDVVAALGTKSSSESLRTSLISLLRPPALLFLAVGCEDDDDVLVFNSKWRALNFQRYISINPILNVTIELLTNHILGT